MHNVERRDFGDCSRLDNRIKKGRLRRIGVIPELIQMNHRMLAGVRIKANQGP